MSAIKRHVVRAAIAAAIPAVALLQSFLIPLFFRLGGIWSPWHWPRPLQLAVNSISLLTDGALLPAMFILAAFGDRGGPDGMPGYWNMLIATFFLWWFVLDFARPLWRWFVSATA